MKISVLAALPRAIVAVFAASVSWNCFAQPTITSQTWDLTVNAGESATFSVTATSSSGPLSYQWRKNGDNISGANNSSYTINSAQSSDAAGYYCQVSDNNGPNWSGTAILTVNAGTAPTITAQTWDQTVNAGSQVTFSVTASGTAPLSYQWRKNGDNIAGANNSSYTITSAQSSDAAGYYCWVSNAYGDAWSGTAILTVNAGSGPVITAQTWDQTVNAGSPVTFSVTASGTDPLAYQWRKNGDNIAGANNSSYTINSAQASDAAGYYCWVSNAYGDAWSGTAILTVGSGGSAPTINTQPQNREVAVGGTATFTVAASGSPAPDYQWRHGTTNVGTNSSTLTLSNVQTADAGSYSVVVSNSHGNVTSSTATLTVNTTPSAPNITAQPQNREVAVGDTATFTVTATGNPAPDYQWRHGTTNVGTNSSTLTLPNVQTANAGSYSVVVSNSQGNVTSSSATLTVTPPSSGGVAFSEHPRTQRVVPGRDVFFRVKATGAGLTYKWYHNSTLLSGQTSASLTLQTVQAEAAGDYFVVVKDSSNVSKASAVATLFVEDPPPVGDYPAMVEVRTAAPKVLVVILQSPWTEEWEFGVNPQSQPPPLELEPSDWAITQNSIAAIHRYSIPWDEKPAKLNPGFSGKYYPIVTRHQIYLRLNTALAEGQTYVITHPHYGSKSFTFRAKTSFCESIKVNQVGYSKFNAAPFANFGLFMGDGHSKPYHEVGNTPKPIYRIFDEGNNDAQVGPVHDAEDVKDDTTEAVSSGEMVYKLKLDGLPPGGPYYIVVEGAGRSRSFGVGDTYGEYLARVTMRSMYHMRCGMALLPDFTDWYHGPCHTRIRYDLRSTRDQDSVDVTDPGPHGTTADGVMAGGYHDAGDMDHTKAHPQISIQMLSFFEAFPDRFKSHQYGIHRLLNKESIPDVMEEILWGVQLWENLQLEGSDPQTGGVMSGWSGQRLTGYGEDNASNDPASNPPYLYGTMQVEDRSTAYCAGIFAQTARLLRRCAPGDQEIEDRAAGLMVRAKAAWEYLETQHSFDETGPVGKTHLLYAALQLFLAVEADDPKSGRYHDIFKKEVSRVIVSPPPVQQYPEAEYECYGPGDLNTRCHPAHFISYILPPMRADVHPTTRDNLQSKILDYPQRAAQTLTFGRLPDYRAYPQGVVAYLGLGNGTAQGRYASPLMYAVALLDSNQQATKDLYTSWVAQYADYSLGLNPMGLSFYSGIGADPVNSPLDCNSYFTKMGLKDDHTPGAIGERVDQAGNPIGNVPGLLVYGPDDDRSNAFYELAVSRNMYPQYFEQPQLRHYAHGWSLIQGNEFTTHETLVWNALMMAFLYTP
jgi:endoglucanase